MGQKHWDPDSGDNSDFVYGFKGTINLHKNYYIKKQNSKWKVVQLMGIKKSSNLCCKSAFTKNNENVYKKLHEYFAYKYKILQKQAQEFPETLHFITSCP